MSNRSHVRELWPLVFVSDITTSMAFYRDRLGFEIVGEALLEGQVTWCRLKRGGASIMLQQAEPEDGSPESWGRGVGFYFVCDDALAAYVEFTANGLSVEKPIIAEYGMKQLFVPEPDGYFLCFESPVPDFESSTNS